MWDVRVIDSGRSMAPLEPDIQNFLGFPDGISGEALDDQTLIPYQAMEAAPVTEGPAR